MAKDGERRGEAGEGGRQEVDADDDRRDALDGRTDGGTVSLAITNTTIKKFWICEWSVCG